MDGLSAMLNLVNYVFVLIFGIVVSFYFADITWEDNKKIIISTLVAFALLQAVCYVLLGERILYKSYPFIIHIPLILVIRYVCHKNIYISTIAVLSAYLMCTPRKWFGTVAAYIIKDIPMISDIVTIIITIPLLFIVIKYISPYIIKLENESKTILSIFFFLPLTYYISEYAFTVYTDLLYRGETIVIEFMDSFIVILYFLLSIVTLTILNRKNAAERENIILLASAAQAEKEISQLYEYQRQAAIYRHDLRHHMNFLQSCLNAPDASKKEAHLGNTLFREGDKVMQTKNNYQLEWEIVSRYGIPIDKGVGIFNGDMGVIREINDAVQTVLVEFEEQRRVTYSFSQMEEVELAYAITIHKSQGSEYPAVVMPLLGGPRMLFNRNLFYTGVTRAKDCVTILGSSRIVEEMIANESESKRFTSLDTRIRELKGEGCSV